MVAALLGLQVIKKAAKGTGVDFWLGDASAQYSGYECLVRLEVSGILEDNEGGTPKMNVTERR